MYAGIGASKMVRLSFDYIAILALGFSSQAEMKAQGHQCNVLAHHQTRWTVNALADRGFFVKASANRRHMWYSHSMDLFGLANALVKREESKAKPSSSQVTKAIQAATKPAKPKLASATKIVTEADTEQARRNAINTLSELEKRA